MRMQISWLVFPTGVVLLASVTQLFADFLSCRLMLVSVSAIQERAHESTSRLLGSPFLDPSRTAPCLEGERADQGLRGQPTYDKNGVASPIARFRHPCVCQDRGHAVCHFWRRAKCRAFQAPGAKVPGDGPSDSGLSAPPAVMVPGFRASPWMVRKLVEQMLERSGDF